ncbi:hypothetical protein ACVILL_007628 [Bradyrhizobium sp. USDA 3364]
MTSTTPATAFATDHDQWISCSHWGMFPLRQAH